MSTGILIADDEPDVVELFQQRFRHEVGDGTYRLHFASSGEGALTALSSGVDAQVMVVLSDINMPGMSGFELLQQVKSKWPSLPVLLISAYADEENRRRATECGADDFIAKPVDFATLKKRLSTLISVSAAAP